MARLTGTVYKVWVEAFKDAFSSRNDVEFVVRAAGREFDQVVPDADLGEQIEVLIRKADDEAWLGQLLTEALARQPGRQQLQMLSVQLETMVAIEPDDPFDALRIFGDPMIDRLDFRAKLKALQTDGAAPVLLVVGEPLSGKTWSIRLISYVVNRLEGVSHVLVDVETQKGKPVDAATLGSLIAEQAGFARSPPTTEEQDSQWVRQYCTWFSRQAKAAGGSWWIILDHLQKVVLTQSATDFLYGLAKEIPRTMPMVRLIILSYHDPAALAIGVGRMDREEVPNMPLDEIKQWLVKFFGAEYLAREQAANRAPNQEELQLRVAQSTDAVLAQIVDNSPSRLVQMCEAVRMELSHA